jgi:hypothetical protein
VTASSGTVLANLAYLIGAVVVAAVAGFIVWYRHRQPKSVDANVASFRRGLHALAPDPRAASGSERRPRSGDSQHRPVAANLIHVRIGPHHPTDDRSAASEAGGDLTGGASG